MTGAPAASAVRPLTASEYSGLVVEAAVETFGPVGLKADSPDLARAVARGAARLARLELDAPEVEPEPRKVDPRLYTVRREGGSWVVRNRGRLEGPTMGPDQPTQRTAFAFAHYLATAAQHGASAQTEDARLDYLVLSTLDTKDA